MEQAAQAKHYLLALQRLGAGERLLSLERDELLLMEGAVSEGEAFCEEIADFLLAQAGKRGVGARAE